MRDAASSPCLRRADPAPSVPHSLHAGLGILGGDRGVGGEAVEGGAPACACSSHLSYLSCKVGVGGSTYSTGLWETEQAQAGESPLRTGAFCKGWVPGALLIAPAVPA